MTIVYNSDNTEVANITTTLTVITRGLENGTNITCLTNRRLEKFMSSSILYIAGMAIQNWYIALVESAWIVFQMYLTGLTP